MKNRIRNQWWEESRYGLLDGTAAGFNFGRSGTIFDPHAFETALPQSLRPIVLPGAAVGMGPATFLPLA